MDQRQSDDWNIARRAFEGKQAKGQIPADAVFSWTTVSDKSAGCLNCRHAAGPACSLRGKFQPVWEEEFAILRSATDSDEKWKERALEFMASKRQPFMRAKWEPVENYEADLDGDPGHEINRDPLPEKAQFSKEWWLVPEPEPGRPAGYAAHRKKYRWTPFRNQGSEYCSFAFF